MSSTPNKKRRSLMLGAGAAMGSVVNASSAVPSSGESVLKQRFFFPGTTSPVVCGRLYTYQPGSSVPKATYKDQAEQYVNLNPIPLDPEGVAFIHWDGVYKIVLEDSSGRIVYKIDNYLGTPDALFRVYTPEGSALVGFQGQFSGAQPRTTRSKLSERVSVADFLDTPNPTASQATAALQNAICSGARRVFISEAYEIVAGVTLAADQILDFDGGILTLVQGAAAPDGILYATSKAGVEIIGARINANAASGGRGISLIDCPRARIFDFELLKCSLALESSRNFNQIEYRAQNGVINLNGWLATACYVSGVDGASITDVETYGGREGVGIYNNARNVRLANCRSHRHTQDGFVIVSGQYISYTGCIAHSCGQSGFATHRQKSGADTGKVSYSNCHAYENLFDGFDLRGASGAPWNVDMLISATGCISCDNKGVGFYVVNAEGSVLSGCVATRNKKQNIFIHGSRRVVISGCESISGAVAVADGNGKAGILVYDSSAVIVSGCISTNSDRQTQCFGISFTGDSTGCQVIGGYYKNNLVAEYDLGKGNKLVGV